MDEYISRKEAIDKMRSLQSRFRAKNDWDSGYDTAIAEAFEHIKRVPVADVQPVDRWISVKDKLPNEGERVLIYAPKTQIQYYVAIFYTLRDEIKFTMNINGISYCWYANDVTHWQPLPESPKDGDT